jgi:MFS family permease
MSGRRYYYPQTVGNVLFGSAPSLTARQTHRSIDQSDDGGTAAAFVDDDDAMTMRAATSVVSGRPAKGSLSDFFFGFMYEDEEEEEAVSIAAEDDIWLNTSTTVEPTANLWRNPLHLALFAQLALQTAATAVPVTLTAAMGEEFAASDGDASFFASRCVTAAVLGTALGKLLNGPVGDVAGARRTATVYSVLLAASLVLLAAAGNGDWAVRACFWVEFSYSVHWPCCLVVLATHAAKQKSSYGANTAAGSAYEGGIFVTSLALRLGSLVGIPTYSLLLRDDRAHWRLVALLGAWMALVASSVTYLYVRDSPDAADEPQNPVDYAQLTSRFPDQLRRRKRWTLRDVLRLATFVFEKNVLPSVKHIVCSGTFWIVAAAHAGGSMVRTSERVLGTYLAATSDGMITESRAAALSVFLAVGTVMGLIVAGNAFAVRQDRERKWMVSRLYVATIAACYCLAVLAIPFLRRFLPAELLTILQVTAITVAGFGIAVPFYHIPGLVGATFGRDKGLYIAYTDGVAYGLASLVWRVVGNSVQHAGGWVYGWAAVALLLILSAVLMVEFMEHYFCRPRPGGAYETIIFA